MTQARQRAEARSLRCCNRVHFPGRRYRAARAHARQRPFRQWLSHDEFLWLMFPSADAVTLNGLEAVSGASARCSSARESADYYTLTHTCVSTCSSYAWLTVHIISTCSGATSAAPHDSCSHHHVVPAEPALMLSKFCHQRWARKASHHWNHAFRPNITETLEPYFRNVFWLWEHGLGRMRFLFEKWSEPKGPLGLVGAHAGVLVRGEQEPLERGCEA